MLTPAKTLLGLYFPTALLLSACSSSTTQRLPPQPDPRVLPAEGSPSADVSSVYRQIGLMAAPNALAFVGKVSSFATARPETTLVLASISIPNRALTFTREGDRYRAPYEVKLTLNRGDVEAAAIDAMEIVRVGSFREINRTDESVIFQHFFRVQPGSYTLTAMVRDVGGSRAATQQSTVTVPALGV